MRTELMMNYFPHYHKAEYYLHMNVFWIRSSCVVKKIKLLNRNEILEIFNLWTPLNLKQILLIGIRSPFFWKWFIKLANPLKFSAVWTIFFVRSIFCNIFCFQRLCKKSLLGVLVTFSYSTFLWATCYIEFIVRFCKESSVRQVVKQV